MTVKGMLPNMQIKNRRNWHLLKVKRTSERIFEQFATIEAETGKIKNRIW